MSTVVQTTYRPQMAPAGSSGDLEKGLVVQNFTELCRMYSERLTRI